MRSIEELLQQVEQNIDGAVAVTSTVRAARALRQQYNRQQQTAGHQGWRSPQILAWEPWLKTLWDAAVLCGAETRILLNNSQENELWMQVLARDEASKQTISIEGLAQQAQKAWQAMHWYRIDQREIRNDDNVDAKAFSRWAAELEKVCRRSSFLTISQVESELANLVRARKVPLPETIFLVGFDRTTPAQDLLIEALRAAGCQVELSELGQASDERASYSALTFARTLEEEIESAAQWARATLIENPNQRIGVVLPSLGEMRDRLDAVFRRVLAPSSMNVHAANARLPFEFSLGTRMDRFPAVRTALTLLAWLDKPLPAMDASWLVVQGGFDCGSGDSRAMLDKRFRERAFQLGGNVSYSSFKEWLARGGTDEERSFLRRSVERVAVAAKRLDLEQHRPYADWREAMEKLLSAAEWNLLNAADSAEYQLLQRWNELLNELSLLSAVTGSVSFSDAVQRLKALAATMLFTLETRHAPVQILGISEAAGLTFDRIWWLNAQAASWPPRGHAQPFLPWSVQRAARMPYADPAADTAFAERVTRRVLNSAPTAIVSFALQENDPATASAHAPSPEIAISPTVRSALPKVPLIAIEEFLSSEVHSPVNPECDAESSALEVVNEEPAIPFQGTQVRSGVTFLKDQAACPFRAFAEIRLAAEPIEKSDTGLAAAAQGTILHDVLQRFWDEMKSQKRLLESSEDECREILRTHIGHALRRFREHAEESWQRALLDIEADRLEHRLMDWLQVEKLRPDFTVVAMESELEQVRLGAVELRCRIDRIDQVEQGIVLLDYKTGSVDSKACDGERPDEPQLPAYAVLRHDAAGDETPLAGIAFAGLHPRKVDLTVVSSVAGAFPANPGARSNPRETMSPEGMQQLQQEWRTTLTRLAEDFVSGVVVVDPKNGRETCRYCPQGLLCRIREAEVVRDGDSADEIASG
ncbi:MAG TPA: PD-(D/E)XK nuclease family protein, partial [Acidobacteriaceae bacterium]|nr:PD-(D/E)XK nuclease family protein [Acidobacteriaceae bacterium]